MALAVNSVHPGDCIEGLAKIEPGSIDLAFADPPFNIGYEYDVYEDRRSSGEYLDWSRKWMSGVWKALKPSGTFWLAIGDEYAAELKVIAQNEVGFTCRSWVIWYYTFGVNCTHTFNRSHTHLFYFVKNPGSFTFNADNPVIRVPSARQLVYADARANPHGRLPDNTWILRPQDVPDGFAANHDTWYFARVAGTFKEREGFHGCQMPEQLLGRIIRCSSNPMEIILDPFGGSGTTFAVAKKLGRQWIGFELSKDYVEKIRTRMKKTKVGDPLDGPADPLTSAPPTALGKRRKTFVASPGVNGARRCQPPPEGSRELESGIADAYQSTPGGWSADHLLADPNLNAAFIDACKKKGLPGGPIQWNQALLRVRKDGKLPRVEKRVRTFTFKDMDSYSFASEIALHQLSVEFGMTLDGILCDPQVAARFDEIASVYSPGHTPFEYRWAALAIRKRAERAKKLAKDSYETWCKIELPRASRISARQWNGWQRPGVYVLSTPAERRLYIGETLNLHERIELTIGIPFWKSLQLSSVTLIRETDKPFGLQAFLIRRMNPVMNSRLLVPDFEATA